ncbi:hypothetical protein V6Z12_A11G322100 [Gossypium hirsutum]
MLEKADRLAVQGCGPCCNILPRYRLCRRMAKKQLEVRQLISLCCFDNVVIDKKSPVRAVEKQQGPEAEEMIEKLMELLKGDENKRIAVWGMGGVGKTTLMMKKFLLILDDVWEHIDLDIVGVPQTDDQANRKILLTTRSLDVCRAMMTDEEIKLDVLKQEAAWNLFAQNTGDVVEVPSINPLARAVAKECSGLPLALKTVGKSMRNKRRIELWKHALHHLQHSDPHIKHIEDEVYRRLKLSYDSLPTDRLINEHQPLEDCFNDGIALIETLKDSCLLEQGDCAGTVKLHDVVRDVAIWISTKQGSEEPCTSILFTNITKPPKQFSGFSELTVILLVGLQSLELLDMSFSAYKWDIRCNVDYGKASFNEILTLDRLSIVKLRLDKVDSVTLDSAWLMKLREFNIQISPGSCDSNHLATQHDEKRAILRGVDLMGIKGLNGLLDTASALDLVICGGISALSELSISHRLSSLQSVKSLSISKCDCITSLISGDNISGTILPNLEHLSLNRLENLGAILGGMTICSRLPAWPALEMIEVRNCPMLTKLPFATSNGVAATLKEIRGELQWWNRLIYSNDEIKSRLQQRFQPLKPLQC